jgi:catechol 2,3-dioxygenase-like lactoylglutathione lyase family enzyme
MVTGIDHIVIVVADLEAAIADYIRLGFTVVRGGRHSGLGTHNALIAFADGVYFELIAFIPPLSPNLHWWHSVLARGGGLADFCVRSNDLETDAAAFRNAGAEIGAPFPMSRERPDGYRVSWVLAANDGPSRGVVPFFIRDTTPRDERVPRQHTHQNGVTAVTTLALAVTDVTAIARIYATALAQTAEPVGRPELRGAGVRFTIGSHELQLLAPANSSGLIAERLRMRGPSPFEVRLSAPHAHPALLDPAHTCGARLIIA